MIKVIKSQRDHDAMYKYSIPAGANEYRDQFILNFQELSKDKSSFYFYPYSNSSFIQIERGRWLVNYINVKSAKNFFDSVDFNIVVFLYFQDVVYKIYD